MRTGVVENSRPYLRTSSPSEKALIFFRPRLHSAMSALPPLQLRFFELPGTGGAASDSKPRPKSMSDPLAPPSDRWSGSWESSSAGCTTEGEGTPSTEQLWQYQGSSSGTAASGGSRQ